MSPALLVLALLGQLDGGVSPVLYVEAAELRRGDAGITAVEVERGFGPGVDQVTAARLLVPDAGWVAAGPGCFAPLDRCLVQGQKVTAIQAENAELRRVPPGVMPQIIAACVGAAIGAAAAAVGVCTVMTGNPVCVRAR